MTRDEILNMPAGREMDALVAEKVTKLSYILHDGTDKDADELTPHYSTDITAAWELIKRFNNHCMLNNVHGMWECYLPNGEGRDKSAPLAICRAALLAVMK